MTSAESDRFDASAEERAAYRDFIMKMLERADFRKIKIVYEFVLHLIA